MSLAKRDGMYKVIALQFTDHSRRVFYDIEEYACGYGYFYVRHHDSTTESFPRAGILSVERRVRDGSFHPIRLKKPRLERGYEPFDPDESAL
jgi:hypothetical protein